MEQILRTNEEMYQDFLEGHLESYDELVLANRSYLIKCIRQYIDDEYIAEDLCQEIFIRIFLHKANYNKEYSFRSYLRMLAKYESFDNIRKMRKEKALENLDDFDELASDDDVETMIFDNLDKEQIKAAVKMLKKEYQEVIYLIEYKRLSYKKAANMLNRSVVQIKILTYRAKQKIKFIIESGVKQIEK